MLMSLGLAKHIVSDFCESACQMLRGTGPRTAPTRPRARPCPVNAASDDALRAGPVEAALKLPGPRRVRVPRESSSTTRSFALSVNFSLSWRALPAGKARADGPEERTTITAAEAETAANVMKAAAAARRRTFIFTSPLIRTLRPGRLREAGRQRPKARRPYHISLQSPLFPGNRPFRPG